MTHAFPSRAHERAAEEITAYFADREETDAVLLKNSCARGKATPDSCLDMEVVVPTVDVERVDAEWHAFARESDAIADLLRAGRFSDLHLDVSDGVLVPGAIDEEAIDYFEVSVGNLFVYSVPLHTNGPRLEDLRSRWLPFYDDALRSERLGAARWFVLDNNLARIPWYVERGLHFQAFDRFYRAFQGFLLGLHVSRRTYPLDYNKWIEEQVAENLGLPGLYERLPRLFELVPFDGNALEQKAGELQELARTYLVDSRN